MKYIEPVMKLSDPEKEWFEVWYVEGVNYFPSYLVVVLPNPGNQEEIIIVDPAKNEVIYKSQNYEDIHQWLTEDDFSLVTGREFNYVR
jgi:hypothetical protein